MARPRCRSRGRWSCSGPPGPPPAGARARRSAPAWSTSHPPCSSRRLRRPARPACSPAGSASPQVDRPIARAPHPDPHHHGATAPCSGAHDRSAARSVLTRRPSARAALLGALGQPPRAGLRPAGKAANRLIRRCATARGSRADPPPPPRSVPAPPCGAAGPLHAYTRTENRGSEIPGRWWDRPSRSGLSAYTPTRNREMAKSERWDPAGQASAPIPTQKSGMAKSGEMRPSGSAQKNWGEKSPGGMTTREGTRL